MRALQQLAKTDGVRYPQAAQVILNDVYVDDIVSGADTLHEVLELKSQLISLLRQGGFEVSKWRSNIPRAINDVNDPSCDTPLTLNPEDDHGSYKILGLQYLPFLDCFTFSVISTLSSYTKRGILSTIARIYDPLGFLAPVVFLAKIILKEVWLANCDWDDLVPSHIGNQWHSFTQQLEVGAEGSDEEPDFSGPIKNATVALGREAVLSCFVTDLGPYKVGWLKAEDQTVLTLHTRVVTHNARISVSHDNERVWRLHIRQLRESDRGCYMCQINTSVMKKQIGCIDVHVPPDIVDSDTSSDVTVEEGGEATITCRARGRPDPRILWRREDSSGISLKGKQSPKVETHSGDRLVLSKVDRSQMGAYLCIASNDVPPAVSKRISLNVNFAPSITVANQLLGSPPGNDVTMGCHVEAYPNTINYWLKNRGQMLLSNGKHVVEEERNLYRVHLKLTIKNFNTTDTGTYTCVSTNSLGKAEGSVRLYEIKIPTTTTTTTSTTTSTTSTTEMPTTDEASTTEIATTPKVSLPPQYQDELNEVDTSSVKSGRNSRRRQHFAASSSSNHHNHLLILLLTLSFTLFR